MIMWSASRCRFVSHVRPDRGVRFLRIFLLSRQLQVPFTRLSPASTHTRKRAQTKWDSSDGFIPNWQ
jgi:hypothetical protein